MSNRRSKGLIGGLLDLLSGRRAADVPPPASRVEVRPETKKTPVCTEANTTAETTDRTPYTSDFLDEWTDSPALDFPVLESKPTFDVLDFEIKEEKDADKLKAEEIKTEEVKNTPSLPPTLEQAMTRIEASVKQAESFNAWFMESRSAIADQMNRVISNAKLLEEEATRKFIENAERSADRFEKAIANAEPAAARLEAALATANGKLEGESIQAPSDEDRRARAAATAARRERSPRSAVRGVQDQSFYYRAVNALTAALLTPMVVLHESDEKLATSTAETIAKIFDSGIIPDGYILPANLAAISISLYYKHEKREGQPVTSNEWDRQPRRSQLNKHVHEMKLGEVRTVTHIKSENNEALLAVRGINTTVRDAALSATTTRLTAFGRTITGAHRDEVIGIAVDEILRSIRLAEKYNVNAFDDLEQDVAANGDTQQKSPTKSNETSNEAHASAETK